MLHWTSPLLTVSVELTQILHLCSQVSVYGRVFIIVYTGVSVKCLLFVLCSLSDNWQLQWSIPSSIWSTRNPKHLSSGSKYLSSNHEASARQVQSIWQMSVRCICVPDALAHLRYFGLLVRCLRGCFTSSCQLTDKEHKANSKRLMETAVHTGMGNYGQN